MTTSLASDAWYTNGPEEVADGVIRLPTPVAVKELHAVNVYVLRDPDGGIDLVDAGDRSAIDVGVLDDALRPFGTSLAEVRRVLVTHVHPDHYTLAGPIRARGGAAVHLGAGERENLNEMNRLLRGERAPNVVTDLERVGATSLTSELAPSRLVAPDGQPPWDEPDVWMRDGDRFRGGARDLTAIATPGHTRGHIVFHDPIDAMYFTGDHVLPHITPSIGFESAPVATALADYLDSLYRLIAMPDGVLLPAHGRVGPSTRTRAEELVAHHERRLADTFDAVGDAGSTAFEVARRLTWTRHDRAFGDLQPWQRFLASTETSAHLVVLVMRGQLEPGDARAGAQVFRAVGGADVA